MKAAQERSDRVHAGMIHQCVCTSPEQVALCLQQTQVLLPAPDMSMRDVARWFLALAREVGSDLPLEAVIQHLCAMSLEQQLLDRRRHKQEQEREAPNDGRI